LGGDTALDEPEIETGLGTDVLTSFFRHLTVVKPLHDLSRPERNQDAEDDHPNLADEFAPPVQWLGNVEMHAAGLRAVTSP
jgi:hypothetical protein